MPALLLPAVLVLAACGAGPGVANLGGASPTPSGSSGSGSTSHSLEAFSQCMRAHGVTNFPDPGSGGDLAINANNLGMDPNSATFQNAQKACQKNLPNGGKISPSQQAAMEQQALKFSQCMRAHGIANFPDPQFHSGPGGGAGVSLQLPAGTDAQSPQFQAAQNACQKDLPKAPGGSTQSGGGSGGGPGPVVK
jgi:hypothetical protein